MSSDVQSRQDDIRHKKLVDANEPENIRSKLLELGWFQQRLYSADYMFFSINYKRVGIERKTTSDFAGSLGDRLSNQLDKMLEHFDISILLIEGSWQIARDQVTVVKGIERWGWTMVWNYLQTWQDKGITLQLTADEGHSVKRINELYAYYAGKAVHSGGLSRAIVGDSRLLAFQCGGIGPKIGKQLLDRFGSLKAVANASVDDYLDVEKMGKTKAQRLFDHFNKNSTAIVNTEEEPEIEVE